MSLFRDHHDEELGAAEEAEVHRILGGIQGHQYQAGYSGMVCTAMVELPDGTGDACGRPASDPVHQDAGDAQGMVRHVNHGCDVLPILGQAHAPDAGQTADQVNAVIRQRIARSLATATDQVQLCLGYLDTIGQARAADDIRGVLVGLDNARQTYPVLAQSREARHV